MEIKELFSVLAGVLFVAGFGPYIWRIWSTRNWPMGTPKKAEPSKVSWIIWISLDTITLAGMFAKHTQNGQIIGAVSGGVIVLALTLKYGKSGWTWIDKACLAGGAFGIALWAVTGDPVMAILVSNSVVVLGAIPTFINGWKDPESESRLAWTMFWVSCVMMLFSLPAWTFEHAAQPVAFFIDETVMMVLLWIVPRFKLVRDDGQITLVCTLWRRSKSETDDEVIKRLEREIRVRTREIGTILRRRDPMARANG